MFDLPTLKGMSAAWLRIMKKCLGLNWDTLHQWKSSRNGKGGPGDAVTIVACVHLTPKLKGLSKNLLLQ
jgi:hypothetical protein